MSLRIEDDELRRKRQDDYGMNVGQVQMPQPNGFPNGGGEMSFADKYGTDNIFGVSPDQVQTPTFQTSGSQAGSSAGSSLLPPDNNSGGTFSLSDAVQMDNLPVAATATPVQTPCRPAPAGRWNRQRSERIRSLRPGSVSFSLYHSYTDIILAWAYRPSSAFIERSRSKACIGVILSRSADFSSSRMALRVGSSSWKRDS